MLASRHIDREKNPAIMLGQSPQRDRDIEAVQTMIKNCAAAGIPCLKYNMSILGVLRTGRKDGRAGTSYSYFKLADAKADPAAHQGGRGQSRHVLGADHLLPGTRDPRGQRVQGDAWRATRTTR